MYSYDDAGNILSKTVYPYTTGDLTSLTPRSSIAMTYIGDRLMSYNGKSITYDAIGNPLTHDGATFTWNGRQLESYSKGNTTVSYQYNAEGIRTVKIVNGIRHEYYLNGSQIIREVIYDSTGTYITTDLWYSYDGEGHPTSIRYLTYNAAGTETGDTVYHLVTNAQGDVTGICDASGNLLYTYIYDAWGTVIQGKQIASGGYAALFINPFLYRGYYYDMETGYYYLNSRYYSSYWGRFLNADDVTVLTATPNSLTDKNLYAYCDNNPVMRVDDGGEFWNLAAGAIFGALLNVTTGAITAAMTGQEYTWQNVLIDAASGAITGMFAAMGVPAIGQAAIGGIVAFGGSIATDLLNGEEANWVRAANAGALGFATGYWAGPGVGNDPAIIKAGGKFCKEVLPITIKTSFAFARSAFAYGIGMYSYDQVNKER